MHPDESAPPRVGPWGIHSVPEEDELGLEIGPLTLRLAQEAGEIRMTFRRGAGEGTDEWTRWAPSGWDGTVSLTPAFPERSLIVSPEDSFWLLAGAEARIYVRVPVVVRVDALGAHRSTLLAIPTIEASDTWWGSMEEGELCYWLGTRARRRITEELWTLHLAICPLQLVNRSEDDLHVDKIALRVEYLSLYAHRDRALWADETRVRYSGDLEGSRLDVSGAPPPEVSGARLLAPPKERMARGFRARTFARLRSIQGWV